MVAERRRLCVRPAVTNVPKPGRITFVSIISTAVSAAGGGDGIPVESMFIALSSDMAGRCGRGCKDERDVGEAQKPRNTHQPGTLVAVGDDLGRDGSADVKGRLDQRMACRTRGTRLARLQGQGTGCGNDAFDLVQTLPPNFI